MVGSVIPGRRLSGDGFLATVSATSLAQMAIPSKWPVSQQLWDAADGAPLATVTLSKPPGGLQDFPCWERQPGRGADPASHGLPVSELPQASRLSETGTYPGVL